MQGGVFPRNVSVPGTSAMAETQVSRHGVRKCAPENGPGNMTIIEMAKVIVQNISDKTP